MNGQVIADSAALQWQGIYVRRCRFPRVVDRFLVPATPEPLISCGIGGSAEFREREVGETWITRQIRRGDLFVTRSKTPYEVRFASPPGEEMETLTVHIAVDQYLAALEAAHPGKSDRIEVTDYFGRDEALVHLFAAHIAEKYTDAAPAKPDFRGGLPIVHLRRVEDFVSQHLGEDLSVEGMAGLVDLSPFHFSRVFKQSTGMSPLQFVTRERITRAQQLVRETSRSLIEIALDVGYTSPSHFAQVFRRVVGVTPTEFRGAL
jgi:AraC family transcriptional regulator